MRQVIKMKIKRYIMIIFLLLSVNSLYAQEAKNNTDNQKNSGNYLDLTGEAIRIERKIEMPRVSIFDQRIKPDFDHIALDKSFNQEISGKNEEIKFKLGDRLKVYPIKNVEILIQKNR